MAAASEDGGQQSNGDQSLNLDATGLQELLELLFKLEQEKITAARLIAFVFKSFARLQSGKCVELMKVAVKKSGLDAYCLGSRGYTILERVVSISNSVLRTKTLQGRSVGRAIVIDDKDVVDTNPGGSTKRAIQINDAGVDIPAVITLPGGSPKKAIVVEDSTIDTSVETLSDRPLEKVIVIEDTGVDKLADTLSNRSPKKVIVVEDSTDVEAHVDSLPGRSTSEAIVIEDTGLATHSEYPLPDRSPSKVIVVEDAGVDAPVDTLSTRGAKVIQDVGAKKSVETLPPVRSHSKEILMDDTQTDIPPKKAIVIDDSTTCVDALRSTRHAIVVDDTTPVDPLPGKSTKRAIVIDDTRNDTPVVVESEDEPMDQELLELHSFMKRMILAVISKVKPHPGVTMADEFVSRSSTEVPKLSPVKDPLGSQTHSIETLDLHAVHRHSLETGDTLAFQRHSPETRDLHAVQRHSPGTRNLHEVQLHSLETRDLHEVQRHSPETRDLLAVQHNSPETRDLLAVQSYSPETRDLLAVQLHSPETRDSFAVQPPSLDTQDSLDIVLLSPVSYHSNYSDLPILSPAALDDSFEYKAHSSSEFFGTEPPELSPARDPRWDYLDLQEILYNELSDVSLARNSLEVQHHSSETRKRKPPELSVSRSYSLEVQPHSFGIYSFEVQQHLPAARDMTPMELSPDQSEIHLHSPEKRGRLEVQHHSPEKRGRLEIQHHLPEKQGRLGVQPHSPETLAAGLYESEELREAVSFITTFTTREQLRDHALKIIDELDLIEEKIRSVNSELEKRENRIKCSRNELLKRHFGEQLNNNNTDDLVDSGI